MVTRGTGKKTLRPLLLQTQDKEVWLYLDDGKGAKPIYISKLDKNKIPKHVSDQLTVRSMWGLKTQLDDREWSFLMNHPQTVATRDGKPEQLIACAALQKN